VPKVTNFLIKIYPENLCENEDYAGNKRKHTSINMHIAGGARGLMGLKGSTSVCRLLPSCEGGSSITGVSVAGAATNLFGSSSSLKRKQKVESFTQVDTKQESI
jgi:hypothetical protein